MSERRNETHNLKYLEDSDSRKWNVTPLIRRGSNFYFLAALYFALLDLLPCLQARGTRDCNKGTKSSWAKSSDAKK